MDLEPWCAERCLDRDAALKLYYELKEEGLLHSRYVGLYPCLTATGIFLCEKIGVNKPLTEKHEALRQLLIEEALKMREEHGPYSFVDWRRKTTRSRRSIHTARTRRTFPGNQSVGPQ